MQQSLIEQCKTLKLANVPHNIYQNLPFNQPEQYLKAFFAEEIKARAEQKNQQLIKTAGFTKFSGRCCTHCKTFLATALGLIACTKDKLVRFYRCLDLANALFESHR